MSESQAIEIRTKSPSSGIKAPAPGPELKAVLAKAAKGDKSCLPSVRALLADAEVEAYWTKRAGSPAEWFRQSFIEKVAGESLLIAEATRRKLSQVQADLEGPNPTAIERLLAERAALCWAIVNLHERLLMDSGSISLPLGDYYQRRIHRAHQRFLSALETLARVRKMALPSVQVNLGMIAVAVVAIVVGGGIEGTRLIRLRRHYQKQAYQAQQSGAFLRTDVAQWLAERADLEAFLAQLHAPSEQKERVRNDFGRHYTRLMKLVDYYTRLEQKYERAARCPWLPVEPDPPMPE